MFIGDIVGRIKPGEIVLVGFQKLSVQPLEICYPIEVKDWTLPVLKSFQKILKLVARNGYELNIKGTAENIMKICPTLKSKTYQTIQLLATFNLISLSLEEQG